MILQAFEEAACGLVADAKLFHSDFGRVHARFSAILGQYGKTGEQNGLGRVEIRVSLRVQNYGFAIGFDGC